MQQVGLHIFVGKFHKNCDISGLNGQNLMRIVQNQEKIFSFLLVGSLSPGKFCGSSCASPKVSYFVIFLMISDQNLIFSMIEIRQHLSIRNKETKSQSKFCGPAGGLAP